MVRSGFINNNDYHHVSRCQKIQVPMSGIPIDSFRDGGKNTSRRESEAGFERGSQNDEEALSSDFGGMAAPLRSLVPSRN